MKNYKRKNYVLTEKTVEEEIKLIKQRLGKVERTEHMLMKYFKLLFAKVERLEEESKCQ